MMRVIGFACIGLFVFGVLVQVLTYRKERAVKPRRIVISQSAAFLAMLVFSLITHRPPGPAWWAVLLTFGFGGGIAYGSLVRMRAGERGVTMSYTLPWLVTWGALMATTQVSSVALASVPVIIYGLAIVNLGVNIGMNTRILTDFRSLAGSLPVLLLFVVAGAMLLAPLGSPRAAAQPDLPDVFQPLLPPGREVSVTIVGLEYSIVFLSFDYKPLPGTDLSMRGTVTVQFHGNREGAEEVYAGQVETWTGGVWAEYGSVHGPAMRRTDYDETGAPYADDIHGVSGTAWIHVYATWWNEGSEGVDAALIYDHVAAAAAAVDLDAVYRAVGGDGVPGAAPPGDSTPAGDGGEVVPGSVPGTAAPADAPPGTAPPAGGTPVDGGDPASITDSGEDPLDPARAGLAVAISSLILSAGSLLQLTDRFSPADIVDALRRMFGVTADGRPAVPPGVVVPMVGAPPADPLAGLPRSADGRVYMRVPWDEAGQAWVTADEARQTLRMQQQGFAWDGRWGWVSGGQQAQYAATLEANRRQNMQQDPELARISRDLQVAREQRAAAEAQAARMAETEARRAELRDQIEAGQREYTEAMGEVSDAEWAYRGVVAVQMAADMAVGTIATVLTPTPLGPLAQGLRVGYNMAKGVGTAVGENVVGITEVDPVTGEVTTRHSFGATDLARGAQYGAVNTALDFTVEAATRGLFGQPQLWKELAPVPPTPANLLSPQAYLRQAVDGVEEVAARDGIEAAAKAADPDKISYLFRDGGREQLAQLEALGKISKAEAAVINRVMDEQVGGSIQGGVAEAAKKWDSAATGVHLERVMLGDSGSSAAASMGKTRSVLTDFDRTVVGVFDPDDVAEYAAKRGISPAQAYQQLNQQLTDSATEQIGKQMPRGITAADADVKLYSGIGTGAGQKDAYATGFTATRQSVQGSGTVFQPGGGSYRTSGQAVVDEADLMKAAVGEPVPFTQPSFPASEFPQVAQQQMASLAKSTDPKTVAKAYDRLLVMAGRDEVAATGLTANPQLAELAREIVRTPQMDKGTVALLARHGYTPESFAAAVSGDGGRLAAGITSAVGQ